MSSTPEGDSMEQQLAGVAEELGIPDSTVGSARSRYERTGSVTVLEDKEEAVVAAAVLSLSCRDDGLPITVADIADAWSRRLDDRQIEPNEITSLFGVLTANLDFQGTPPQPRALIERFGKDLGLPDGVVVVANRILVDIFAENPEMVAEEASSDGIAGSILYLAARINGYDDVDEGDISDTLGTGQFTVQNRTKKIRDMLGKERVANADRYHLDTDGVPKSRRAEQSAETDEPESTGAETVEGDDERQPGQSQQAQQPQPQQADRARADGRQAPDDAQQGGESVPAEGSAGDSPAGAAQQTGGEGDDGIDARVVSVVQSQFPEELPTTDHVAEALDVTVDAAEAALARAESAGDLDRKSAGTTVVWLPGEGGGLAPDLTEDAVQEEVDTFVEALDLSASLRVFARGLISDAVDTLAIENAEEVAGAAVLAACRIQDVEVDATEIAEVGEFETRALYTWLDKLGGAIDMEIPRLDPATVAEQFAESLDIDDTVREESLRALEQYEPRETDPEYTEPELAAGGIVFAATVSDKPVDIEELSTISGADTEYIDYARNSILVSLCQALVAGELAYDETPWTGDLLESDLSQDFGDDEVQRAIALAKTYVAGRESKTVDEATVDVLL